MRARALICLTEEVSQTGSVRGHVIKTYRARARRYDITSNLYYLLGFRVRASRRQAVQALQLRPGDTVVEVGCGTGLNFALLEKAVGPDGQIVGVDLTDAMLAQARRRMQARSWSNVGLVHADVSEFEFPTGVTAILSTYALSLMPECAEIIARGCESLAPGGRWVVLDLKLPENVPGWLRRAVLALVRPFAATEALVARRPWDTIRTAMQSGLADLSWTELFFGFVFLAAGTARDRAPG